MSSVFCFCRGNEQCEKSRQSTMGSLLTNRRIALTFHSATARMSEGKAGANGALRVEFSTFLGLHGAPRKLGKLASWGVYCKFYLGAPHKPGELIFREVYIKLYVWVPRKLRDKPNPSSHGHGCCVSGSGPARLLIASRPNAPLRGLNVGLCGDR